MISPNKKNWYLTSDNRYTVTETEKIIDNKKKIVNDINIQLLCWTKFNHQDDFREKKP